MSEGFEKRILYNAAKPDGCCDVPRSCAYLSRFTLKENGFLLEYPQDDLELVFVELPKFDKPLGGLENQAERWLYFIRHAKDLTAIPAEFQNDAPLHHAFDLANIAQLSPEEEEEYGEAGNLYPRSAQCDYQSDCKV